MCFGNPGVFVPAIKLTVVGKLADPAQGRPDMSIDAAFEGIEDSTYDHCYISMGETDSQARIDIEPSAVTKLKLLSGGQDCCGKSQTTVHPLTYKFTMLSSI